jgi:hypothetical protein
MGEMVMNCYKDTCFLGDWKFNEEQGTLSIKKIGED